MNHKFHMLLHQLILQSKKNFIIFAPSKAPHTVYSNDTWIIHDYSSLLIFQ